MIDKHYNLSCYALEHPFQTYYSQTKQMIQLIDSNNDIFQFRLPDCQHYEKLEANWKVRQYFRFHSITLILYETNHCYIFNNEQAPIIIENVGEVSTYLAGQVIYFIMKNCDLKLPHLEVKVAVLVWDEKKTGILVEIGKWKIQPYQVLHSEIHHQQNILGIEAIFGNYCLLTHEIGSYSLVRLCIDSNSRKLINGAIKYDFVNFQLRSEIKIAARFKTSLLFYSKSLNYGENQSQACLHLLKPQQNHFVSLKYNNQIQKLKEYWLYNNFLILVGQTDLLIFETIEGSLMAKINIACMIQACEEGSSVVLGVEHQKELRYSLLLDQLSTKIDHFYLMDKEKMSIYHINIQELLNKSFRNQLVSKFQEIETDTDEIHQNVIKTLNFRLKKLTTLEQYISQGLKTFSLGNAFRFLFNQQNIFVLNDGLFLLFNAIMSNFQRIARERALSLELERQIIKISTKLIMESKYQDHIAKGLTIANSFYADFRNKAKVLNKNDNIELYIKLLESKRVAKLLKQQKNKHLFELSYQLAIAVKGYGYLQDIQKKKM